MRSVVFIFALTILVSCGYGPQVTYQKKVVGVKGYEQARDACAQTAFRDAVTVVENGQRKTQAIRNGVTEKFDTNFAFGMGCVVRPIEEVWNVSRTSPGVHWDETYMLSFGPNLALVDGVQFSFEAFHKATEGFVKPTWYIQWNHRLLEGTAEKPESIAIDFLKDRGTGFIKHWAGQIILHRNDAGNTGVYMEIELQGTRISEQNCIGAVTSQIKRLQTVQP